jgi:presenilin-like A22 family membrane protease
MRAARRNGTFRAMAEKYQPPEGYVITHPNRDKPASKATKAIVVLLLLVTAGLMIVVTIGGWDSLQGAKPVQIAYPLLFIFFAFMIARWNRGLLPVTAALSIILLIFAAVSGNAWFDRDKSGFTSPALDEDIIGLIVFILVPVQILLIGFSMRGFAQAWNVEVERPEDEVRGSGGSSSSSRAEPQPA